MTRTRPNRHPGESRGPFIRRAGPDMDPGLRRGDDEGWRGFLILVPGTSRIRNRARLHPSNVSRERGARSKLPAPPLLRQLEAAPDALDVGDQAAGADQPGERFA